MVNRAAKAKTLTSAPGNKTAGRRFAEGGFTLIELMVVVAVIAIAVGVASLALRDPAETRLDREAVRLGALLESARAEARASGLAVRWQPLPPDPAAPGGDNFRFVGLPASNDLPTHWLDSEVSAQVVGAPSARLGPEATIGAQRIVLRLDQRSIVLGTDGLGPFVVLDGIEAGS